FIEAGNPTLLLVDPLPVVDISLAPSEKAGAQQNPFQQQRGPQPKPKGNIQKFMIDLGVSWNSAAINWDGYNPHPDLAQIQPEIIFVGEGNENPHAFNQENIVSSGLQELVLLYPGNIQQTGGKFDFEPLLQSSKVSGSIPYQQLVRRSFFGTQLARGIRHIPDGREYTLAAKITSTKAIEDSTSKSDKNVNIIVIADVDFISQQFFELRQRGFENLNFDNVTFFLNSMDMLVGDESFISLRKRRIIHRTLQAVESRMQEHVKIRAQQEQEAEMEAQMEMQKAQQRLSQKVAEVKQRTDLDERTKNIMANNIQKVEQKRFDAMKNSIEEKQKMKVQSSKEEMEAQVKSIQNTIKLFAVMAPPIPVFILGVWIFIQRRKREKEGAIVARRLRS
ncbi:MAG: hypothetical protein KAR38_06765, partial [Calditrichia bacterium]|nr:hypothetical protein [Calditrichia bacterium]